MCHGVGEIWEPTEVTKAPWGQWDLVMMQYKGCQKSPPANTRERHDIQPKLKGKTTRKCPAQGGQCCSVPPPAQNLSLCGLRAPPPTSEGQQPHDETWPWHRERGAKPRAFPASWGCRSAGSRAVVSFSSQIRFGWWCPDLCSKLICFQHTTGSGHRCRMQRSRTALWSPTEPLMEQSQTLG